MIRTLKVTCEANIHNVFATFGCVGSGNFILGEDGGKGTFRNARTAVNAGIRVNIDPRPFIDWLARNHTFNRTDVYATAIANA